VRLNEPESQNTLQANSWTLEIQIGGKELMTEKTTGALRIRIGIPECNEIVDRTTCNGGNFLKF
jgi:hypothetical protein